MPSFQYIVMMALAFMLALTVHEYAHARAALAAGDDTAKNAGRISLNPIDHIDPLGAMMFLFMIINGFGIAWGKPVPVNPYNFKSPRWDSLKVSLWGPLSNLIAAVVLTALLKLFIIPMFPGYIELVLVCIRLNLVLAFFNMIPVAPLDGSKILASLLPYTQAVRYEQVMARYGIIILLAILFTGAARLVIGPPVSLTLRFLLGLG